MIDTKVLFLGAAALLLGASGPVAAQGGGSRVPGNVDIRALEPPIDVRPQQLEAQEPPRTAPAFHGVADGTRRAPARAPE